MQWDETEIEEESQLRRSCILLSQAYHYEKELTKNIRPTDILQIFSKCSQIY